MSTKRVNTPMRPEIFRIDESIGFRIYRAYTQGAAALRKAFVAAGLDLTPEQWSVMTRIKDHAGLSQSLLGEKSCKDRHNVNRLVNILEERGYIERQPDETDKRAYRLYLTATATAVLEQATRVVREHIKHMYGGLSAEDMALLRQMLDHIAANLASLTDPTESDAEDTAGKQHARRLPRRQSETDQA